MSQPETLARLRNGTIEMKRHRDKALREKGWSRGIDRLENKTNNELVWLLFAGQSKTPILFEVFPRPSPDAACWSAPMQSIVRRILIVGVTFGWSIACAHAGPCSNEIAKIDDVMRDPGPNIGPTNPQSIGAQLHRQPTPSSVARAEKRADSRYIEAMARAGALDAEGDPHCMSNVTEVKDFIGMK